VVAVVSCALALLAACGSGATVTKSPVHTTDAELCKALNAVLSPDPVGRSTAKQAALSKQLDSTASKAADPRVRSAGQTLDETFNQSSRPGAGQAMDFIYRTCVNLKLTASRPFDS
jgi:hypothetical protein